MSENRPGYPPLLIPDIVLRNHERRRREKRLFAEREALSRLDHVFEAALLRFSLNSQQPSEVVSSTSVRATRSVIGQYSFQEEVGSDPFWNEVRRVVADSYLPGIKGVALADHGLRLHASSYEPEFTEDRVLAPFVSIKVPLDLNHQGEKRLVYRSFSVPDLNNAIATSGYSLDLKLTPA